MVAIAEEHELTTPEHQGRRSDLTGRGKNLRPILRQALKPRPSHCSAFSSETEAAPAKKTESAWDSATSRTARTGRTVVVLLAAIGLRLFRILRRASSRRHFRARFGHRRAVPSSENPV